LESAEGATRDGQTLVFGEIGAGETREGIATIRLQPFVANGTIVTVDATLNAAAALPVVLDALSVVTRAEPRLADGAQLLTMPRDMIDAGAEIGFTLVFRNSGDGAASRIVIRGAQPPNTAYVPASTSVNGVPLLDRGGTSLLWSDDGLVLSDVTPGAEVLVRWLSIVNTPLPAQTAITARIEIASDDAAPFTVESQPIVVRSAPAFAVPSVSLPFSIAGAAASVPLGGSLDRVALEGSMRRVTPLPGAVSADRIDAQAVPAEGALPVHMRTAEPFEDEPLDQSVVLIVADFSAERIGRTLEYLEESSFGGLISHLFVLRALFPDRVSGNGSAAKALATELATLREIFDHLFVRLRMPRFRIGPKDLETERSRDATRSLFAALAQERVERLAPPAHDVTRLVGTVDKAECERFVRAIEAAPMGGAAPWHALAHLLGADLVRAEVHHDSAARYRDELISTLGAFLDRPVASFMSALGTERSAELDGALGALVQDLRPQDDEPLEAHEAASEVR